MGWRNASFRGFADYTQTSESEAGLHRFVEDYKTIGRGGWREEYQYFSQEAGI